MNPITTSLIAFAFVFGGALLGVLLRSVLPEHHLSADSKDLVKHGMGLVATMAALVLGLLVASAKESYDAQGTALTQLSANLVLLDRMLTAYGPETAEAREILHGSARRVLADLWSNVEDAPFGAKAPAGYDSNVALLGRIHALAPTDDMHRTLKTQILNLTTVLGQTRWLMYAQGVVAVSMPLLVVLVVWLTVIFLSFGLFAPSNATVIASLAVSSLSVSGAILLILEMYSPYTGLVQVSDAPLRAALAQLGP